MTWALLAALTIMSSYALLQHLTIRRLTRPFEPPPLSDASEVGEAILDVVEASLVDGASEWEAAGSDLIHYASGFKVRVKEGRSPRLFKNAVEIALPEWRRDSLMRAIEFNNAKDTLLALGSDNG